MKHLTKILLAIAMIIIMCESAFSQSSFYPQGSVIVPGITYAYTRADYYVRPTIVLNNITDKTIQCRVRVYDHNGEDKTALGRVYTGGTNYTILSSGIGDFEIPPYSSRWFNMDNIPVQYSFLGHATIEWSSSDQKAKKALMGKVWNMRVTSVSICDAFEPINNGQPF
ncbi:hypothetical protein [Maridesulfovibrio sp. FT414]|uniref:hypothetical protein n=1 Tax=Maridesulfovibrio sp. FT414 TaxID=2979469 RepID=UPI003D80498C